MEKLRLLLLISCILLFSMPTQAKTEYVSYSNEIKLVNQMSTGEYSYNNCGIASLSMVMDYLNLDMGTPSYIRGQIKPYDGAIYTNEIEEWLDANDITYIIDTIWDEDDIVEALDDGVSILCLDMSMISGKSYDGVIGHYIIASGYYIDNEVEYLEVYDPMSYKIEYYKLDEVFKSAMSWWRHFILFERER